jgi:hypothetical protein
MADYRATTTTVESWQRCFRIVIENQRGALPRMDCLEEVVTVTDGQEVREQVPGCAVEFSPADVVPLRDPMTGELTGQSVTQAEMYAVMYSAYRHAAAQRDAAQATTP